MTSRQHDAALLVKEVVELCQAQALLLEAIFTAIERMNGHIPEARDLSAIVSQWAGLHLKALALTREP